jgi:hypothetical protein
MWAYVYKLLISRGLLQRGARNALTKNVHLRRRCAPLHARAAAGVKIRGPID